jgi:hypothetical protein
MLKIASLPVEYPHVYRCEAEICVYHILYRIVGAICTAFIRVSMLSERYEARLMNSGNDRSVPRGC